MSSAISKIGSFPRKIIDVVLDRLFKYKWLIFIVTLIDSFLLYYISRIFPPSISVLLGSIVVISSTLVVYYIQIARKIGIIPVSEDLTFILVHARCLVTGNPPLTLLFEKIGESYFYSKRYRAMFIKLRDLVKKWGYSVPDALKTISRETRFKVDEMFFQRFAAIVATGGDVKEYLRLEYNTLFNEYKAAYLRMIDMMRVVLGVYTTLLGALVFMLSTLMLLGMFFGGIRELMITGVLGTGLSLVGVDILLVLFIKKPMFEAKRTSGNKLLLTIKTSGLAGSLFIPIIFALIALTGRIYSMEQVSLGLIIAGVILVPPAILVKIHENTVYELDMFFPAFIRSYGEHMAVLPDMRESLKPLLIAELGKLRKLLGNVYARLVNRIDPRIAWRLFAGETASEAITRGVHIFMDTVELGGDMGEAGALLSDHINELLRLRAIYIQVFKTFEATLYIMHIVAVILTIFITSFIDIFSSVVQTFLGAIPGEFYGVLLFFNISKEELIMVSNLILLTISMANVLALYSVNPGSRYSIYYYLFVIMVLTGLGLYIGSYTINLIMGSILQIGILP